MYTSLILNDIHCDTCIQQQTTTVKLQAPNLVQTHTENVRDQCFLTLNLPLKLGESSNRTT